MVIPSYTFGDKKYPSSCMHYIVIFAHKQQIVQRPNQRLKSLFEARLILPNLHSRDNDRFKHDPSSSTRDCFISRTPGQRILFEQQLLDFKKHYPGGIPILVIIPVSNSAKILADMTSQLLYFTEIFGRSRIVLSFGIGESQDDTYSQISQTTEALRSAKILNRVQFPDDLDDWTRRTLVGYMHDFTIAVILRGVICAIDLARLVIQTVENNADLACSLEVKFDSEHRLRTTSGTLNLANGAPLSTEDLLHASTFIQSKSCESSVQVLSLKALQSGNACIFQSILSNYTRSDKACRSSPKVMISPSTKSSLDPEDFRSAIQLGFMDMQGYDYRRLEWEEGH
jgi:hypothetical protein